MNTNTLKARSRKRVKKQEKTITEFTDGIQKIAPLAKHDTPNKMNQSPNSNSFSMIYDQFYPRTPVKKMKESQGKQPSMDQLEQLLDKGILNIALVQQVSFNSTRRLRGDLQWHPESEKRYATYQGEVLQSLVAQLKNNLELCQVYERHVKVDSESSMLRNLGDRDHSKQSHITTLMSVYANYRSIKSKDHFFTIANPNYIILYAYSDEHVTQGLIPFALYITHLAATSNSFSLRNNTATPLFLHQNQIKSTVVSIDPLLNSLIPSVVSLQFPKKYSVSLIKGKYMHHLFNVLLNGVVEREMIDVAASYPFVGSCANVTQVYNGIDHLVQEPQMMSDTFFGADVTHQEYKIQFDGILTIQQVLNIKNSFKDLGYVDVVVSETKLNPITTLLTKSTMNKITQALNAQ